VRHFSVAKIATLWNLNEDYVRQLFEQGMSLMVDDSVAYFPARHCENWIPGPLVGE
jgi:hypothetical protein